MLLSNQQITPSRRHQYRQKDKRKPILPMISDQKLPVKKWIRKGFLLLPSNF